jgi:hypothetical protein
MRTAEEILFEKHFHCPSDSLDMIVSYSDAIEAMKLFAKEALEEAQKAGVIYTGDPIEYAEIDKKFIQRIIDDLK